MVESWIIILRYGVLAHAGMGQHPQFGYELFARGRREVGIVCSVKSCRMARIKAAAMLQAPDRYLAS
jgi:hypothetical protein